VATHDPDVAAALPLRWRLDELDELGAAARVPA